MTAVRIDGKALAEKVRARGRGGRSRVWRARVPRDDPRRRRSRVSRLRRLEAQGVARGRDRVARPPLPLGYGRERDPRAHRRAERRRRGRRHPRAAPAARSTWTSRKCCAPSIRRRTSTGSIVIERGPSLSSASRTSSRRRPRGVMVMLAEHGVELKGKEAVVIGRSEIVGKPMAMLLLAEHATVTICHSRTVDLAAHTRRADILVAAVGRAGLVTPDMVKPGAVVIDVGDESQRRREARRGRRSGGLRGRRSHDAGSGRRRPDDDRDASAQHVDSSATTPLAGCGSRFLGASVPTVVYIRRRLVRGLASSL